MSKKQPNPIKDTSKKPASRKEWSNGTVALIILALSFILYGNSLNNGFSIDDVYVSQSNKMVSKGITAIPEIFTHHTINNSKGESYSYRPVVLATFAVEHSLFGENAKMSHLINLLLYALTGFLLYLFLRQLFPNYHFSVPLLITFLFIIHPVHTEAVDNIKSRDELLAVLFSILSLSALLRFAEKLEWKYLAIGGLYFLIASLSKATAVAVIVLAPLTIYFFTRANWKNILIAAIVPIAVSIFVFVFVHLVLPKGNPREMMYHENPLLFEKGLALRLGTSLYALGYYLRLLILPHPLLYYYGYSKIPLVGFGNMWVLLSLLVHLGLLGYALWKIKEKDVFAYAILFYMVSIAMFSNILSPSPGLVADRFVYLGSLGFSVALGFLLLKLFSIDYSIGVRSNNNSRYLYILLAIISIACTIKIIKRNGNWKDKITLYAGDNKYLHSSVKANLDYGTELMIEMKKEANAGIRTEEIETAKGCFQRALDVLDDANNEKPYLTKPKVNAWSNLGTTFFYQGKYPEAIKDYQKALDLSPDEFEPMLNMAAAYQQTGELDKAIEYNLKCIKINPGDEHALQQIKSVYKAQNDDKAWEELNTELIASNPKLVTPYLDLGDYFWDKGDWNSSLHYYELAYPLDSNNSSLVNDLAHMEEKIGDKEKSQYYYGRLKELKSANPDK